jgi:hypothetical protein
MELLFLILGRPLIKFDSIDIQVGGHEWSCLLF